MLGGHNDGVDGATVEFIHAGAGNNIVLGDDGKIDYVRQERDGTVPGADTEASDIDLIESLSTTAAGGVDNITTNGDNDIVIGGRFGDTVNAGDGQNIVLGDSGRITAAGMNAPQLTGVPMTFGLIETIEFGDGGSDNITTGTGNDIVLGGHNDGVDGAPSNSSMPARATTSCSATTARSTTCVRSVMVPCPGQTTEASDIDLIESLSTTAAGGVDNITTNGDNDIVIGGRFGDTVNAGDGQNIVLGDSGRITAAGDERTATDRRADDLRSDRDHRVRRRRQ